MVWKLCRTAYKRASECCVQRAQMLSALTAQHMQTVSDAVSAATATSRDLEARIELAHLSKNSELLMELHS